MLSLIMLLVACGFVLAWSVDDGPTMTATVIALAAFTALAIGRRVARPYLEERRVQRQIYALGCFPGYDDLEILLQLVSGEIDEHLLHPVLDHLETCGHCAARLQVIVTLRSLGPDVLRNSACYPAGE